MRRVPHLLALFALLAAELAAVATLHRLGQLPSLTVDVADPVRWLAVTPADRAVVAVARLLATVTAWWLLASTVLALVAHTRDRSARRSVLARLAPRAVRALVDRALATS